MPGINFSKIVQNSGRNEVQSDTFRLQPNCGFSFTISLRSAQHRASSHPLPLPSHHPDGEPPEIEIIATKTEIAGLAAL